MPAHLRNGRVTSAAAPASSHSPVTKITCGANGTQSGVILRKGSGIERCAMPAATKNAASTQRITARGSANRDAGSVATAFDPVIDSPPLPGGCQRREPGAAWMAQARHRDDARTGETINPASALY